MTLDQRLASNMKLKRTESDVQCIVYIKERDKTRTAFSSKKRQSLVWNRDV